MALEKYRKKRAFDKTPEPKGLVGKRSSTGLRFVVQRHDASRLHYDLRLEMKGVMKSWAVPKGPSLDPKVKRLAVHVEDHPISYNTFEGTIPKGQYGAGTVSVWDKGTYHATDTEDPKESEKIMLRKLARGELTFVLEGKKLRGQFTLVRMYDDPKQWLLFKTGEHASAAPSRAPAKRGGTTKADGKTARIPRLTPMLASLTDAPFDGEEWLFEIKWDGYRALARTGKKVDLYSRNLLSYNAKYPNIVAALGKIERDAVLDGEIIAYDDKGVASFQAMQHAAPGTRMEYVVFDILYLDGKSVMDRPLFERKVLLEEVVPNTGAILLSEYIEKRGKAFYEAAAKNGFEGVIAKRRDGRYLPGRRSDSWLKIKHHRTDEAVIAGYTEPKGSRQRFGSLVLGQMKKGKLKFIGHAGTGFDDTSLNDLFKKLRPLRTKASPFKEKVPANGPITWVRPELTAQVKFSEWTGDGIMRHPVYLGLRADKPAKAVTGEKKASPYTHLDKTYFPELGLTKGDVLSYYERIAPYILPHLKDRPESLNRHPGGIHGANFYQKNFPGKVPDFVETYTRRSTSTKKNVRYIVCQNAETLLYMANLGCIEINPWSSRTLSPDRPDHLVIDLDPGENTFDELVTVAKEVKKVLDASCLESYVKTSGKTGMHIFVPFGATRDFGEVREFAELIAGIVHRRLPDLTSIERSPAKRKNLIYLDFLQNSLGQTLAAPYSLRPTPEATVSTPLRWSEVKKGLDPRKFTIRTIFTRLKKHGDLWKPMLAESSDLAKSLRCLREAMDVKK